MESIPLLCNICPKKPRFSDVSHLLTHIASKGHLSHYYKVKIRAGSDAAARQLIDTYDQWYADWNVEELMSERMNLKDKKRSRPRAAAASRASSAAGSSNPSNRTRQSLSRHASAARSTPSYGPSPVVPTLDPRLHEPAVKAEPAATPYLPLQPIDPNVRRPVLQSCQFGHGLSHAYSKHNVDAYNAFVSRYVTPVVDAARHPELPRLPGPARPSVQLTVVPPITVNLTSPSKTPPSETALDDLPCEGNGASKLKGVLWPGMSLFDSATPTARRKRNQKKDASIIEQLEANSLDVEPTEMVWTPEGKLKKQKRISGMVDSSSSPFKSSPVKRQYITLSNASIRQPYFGEASLGRRTVSWMDDDAENGLAYSPFGKRDGPGKRKKGFEVWQDEDVADRGTEHGATFSRPTNFKYLTESLTTHTPTHQASANDENNPSPFRLLEDSIGRNANVAPSDAPSILFSANSQTHSHAPTGRAAGGSSLAELASTATSVATGFGLPASTTGGSNGFSYSGWPQQHNHVQYASASHSRQSSIALAQQLLEHTALPMYGAQPDWVNALHTTRSAAPAANGFNHAHRTSADYQALFAANGFWNYSTNNQDGATDQHGDNGAGFFGIQHPRRTDSSPDIGPAIALAGLNQELVIGMQQLTEAAEATAPPDAKLAANLSVEEGQDHGDHDAKPPVELTAEYDSDETEDEYRTISVPPSQT